MLSSALNSTPLPKNQFDRSCNVADYSLLWRAVLAQAVRDTYCGGTGPRGEIIRWLKTKDFEIVCEFADVEPTSMREQIATLLTIPEPLAQKYGKLLRDKIMAGIHME